MGKWVLVLALVAMTASTAAAQDTIAVYFDPGFDELNRWGTTHPGPFDIVILMKSDSGSTFAEFVMDELTVLVPGVLKTGTTKINNSPIDGGDNTLGEYAIDFGDCVEAGEVEVVRISYVDFGFIMPFDLVLRVRGFQPGDTQPSVFGGEAGYVDCEDTKRVLAREGFPVEDFRFCHIGSLGDLDGACVLNLLCVPTAAENFTALKTRY